MTAGSQPVCPSAAGCARKRTTSASVIAPDASRMLPKLAGSMPPCCSASRHSSELAANATMATAVSATACRRGAGRAAAASGMARAGRPAKAGRTSTHASLRSRGHAKRACHRGPAWRQGRKSIVRAARGRVEFSVTAPALPARPSNDQGDRGFQVFRRRAAETRARKALQLPHHEGRERRGAHLGVDAWRGRAVGGGRAAQHLAQRGLDLVEELVHALLQTLVLEHQRIADHDARHTGVALGELHEQHEDAGRLLAAGGTFALEDLVDQREDALLDEVDEALEHLGLAREVAVQGRLAHLEPRGQRGGGDPLGTRLLQHGGQRLQDLHAPFARLGALARRCGGGRVGRGLYAGGSCLFVLHGSACKDVIN
eukprot:Opistho-1_new@93748